MGGEKRTSRVRRVDGGGSPPRGRGKVYAVAPVIFVNGITPAWAGKSRNGQNPDSTSQDHPRVGGEKVDLEHAVELVQGSPPRGRGKAFRRFLYALRIGITPAWAGKRICPRPGRMNSEDHPRVGGEKALHIWMQPTTMGSPPRGRGKVQRFQRHNQRRGITPAWAGKSFKVNLQSIKIQDHPRVGGEKLPFL